MQLFREAKNLIWSWEWDSLRATLSLALKSSFPPLITKNSLILQRSTHGDEDNCTRPLAMALLRKQQVSWNDKQDHSGPQVTCSQPRELMQPKSKGHSRFQLRRRCQTLGAGAHIFLSANPRASLGDPVTRKTDLEAERSRARKGLQEVVPKKPPGHVRDTHLFILSRPGRTAIPCKFGMGPAGAAKPSHAAQPRVPGAFPSCRAAIAGRRGGGSGSSSKCGRTGEGSLLARARSV